ncbi:DUF4062 domain-containing protein [Microbulbifer rhizosphaerae]|uniref:DUF4062 domain-containing protein n=1 Tax=Microbulbifer rhizosphaerae TaxID=1562603 RepID=A0A7W4WC04_9GAMM|nr:DUF4062 domain-containing protein [Microbulbifer rhizosphaerae]MBB3061489.1 hypothetical protein [Microbulbifer rhizosphaerae]
MEKRYQVFVSSTYADLSDERQNVFRTLMEMDCMPAGMELFPAADEEQWDFIKKIIDDSDYYLIIIGGRYGSLTGEGISYTEKEFDYAVEKGIKVIALIHESPDDLSLSKSEKDPDLREKLDAFKDKVKDGRLVKFWNRAEELSGLVALSLTKTMKAYPAVGWTRADSLASDKANRKILELQDEIETLRKKISSLSSEAPEGAELLAQGSDTFVMRLKANYSNSHLPHHDPDKGYPLEFDLSISWDELFSMVGVPALHPVRETKLKSQLCTAIKDSYIKQLLEQCDEGYRLTGISISETIFQTIKYQFSALGYLNTLQEVKLSKDTEKEISFCELTPYGKRKLMEVRAIYRDSKPNRSSQKDALTRALLEAL